MRLTLRTLLAYMDGLLDAKDSQEIGKRIEDSKFAKELFHKIRDVMRRLRLGAPSLTERAANLDCNTVAEYLDNALPSDRVPDFEEVSLKSEMHLAEVASCHQILTMVLGEPVEIDPESRQRMYQLPTIANRVDEERIAAAEAANMLSGDGNGPVPPIPQVKTRPRPIVPEYLRDPPKKSRLLLAAAIMLFVGAAIGLVGLTVYPNGARWLQAKLHDKSMDDDDRDSGPDEKHSGKPKSVPEDEAAAKKSSGSAAMESGLPGFPKESGTSLTAPGNSLSATGSGAESLVPPLQPITAARSPTGSDLAPGKGSASLVPSSTSAAPPTIGPTTGAPINPDVPAATAGVAGQSSVRSVAGPDMKPADAKSLPGASTSGTAAGPASASPPVKPTAEVAKVDSNPGLKPDLAPPGLDPANPPPSREDKLKIGHFISDREVLLKLEPNNGWQRVLPEEFIAGRQPLLALPSYRPRLALLNVGAMLELINGTRIELLPETSQGLSGIDVDFGRLVINPLAQAGARLRVVVGSHSGTITLTSVDSIAGLEVTRVHEPGTDPEKVFSRALTKLYVARGGAIWEEGEGKPPVRLKAPAELMLDGAAADAPSGPVKDVPKWLTANTVNELDQRAALSVSQALSPQRAARLGLTELTDARQKEIRWLVARCLGYLGQFDPMTAALNDVDFRREWPDYIDQLKEAIARGPETAAGIRQSLEKQYVNESGELYRMLWGYTDKQLEGGEDARLVKFLDHESPVFRVLAFWNLNNITHQGLYYRPEANAAKRLAAVQQWRKQQQLGRIRNKLPDNKPRAGSGETPAKTKLPEPPKPLDESAPDEIRPAGAMEPIPPDPNAFGNPPASPLSGPKVNRAERLPIMVPEPEPSERQPHLAVPEPRPANRQE